MEWGGIAKLHYVSASTALTTSPSFCFNATIASSGLQPACDTMVKTSVGSNPARTDFASTAAGSGL